LAKVTGVGFHLNPNSWCASLPGEYLFENIDNLTGYQVDLKSVANRLSERNPFGAPEHVFNCPHDGIVDKKQALHQVSVNADAARPGGRLKAII
jgi:hypothetical protein